MEQRGSPPLRFICEAVPLPRLRSWSFEDTGITKLELGNEGETSPRRKNSRKKAREAQKKEKGIQPLFQIPFPAHSSSPLFTEPDFLDTRAVFS